MFKICKDLHSMCLKFGEMLGKYVAGNAREKKTQVVTEAGHVV